ncbi:MAG TPA: sigma-70 family RNA polymerase sigma factor [Blastocatellia bacterium]|nr:sigma-70 family RNA polymerase sigma factor [Blastocatellia bacterium]
MLATATHLRAVPTPESKLESLFRQHYEQIFRTAYRVTGNANDAEDVLQTVFLRLVRRQNDLEFAPNPKAYLLRAAINASLDIVRTRSVNNLVPIDEVEPDYFATNRNPETQQADRELRQLIQSEIAKLSANAAEMFVLKYFEGYDNKEIAQMLGTSHLVVGVLLHRARSQMKKRIESVL